MIKNETQIKESLTMEEALQRLGHEVNRHRRCACPVHGGTDPNFSVRNGIGTCHSQCGRSWDVVGLVMEVQRLTYPEALEWMATQAGLPVEYAGNAQRAEVVAEAKAAKEKAEGLYLVNDTALRHLEGARSLNLLEDYELDGRSWKGETIQNFHLCVAPAGNVLAELCEKGQLPRTEAVELGLVKMSERDGSYHDPLRGRLIFPIYTDMGKLAGFSGRKPAADNNKENPKYKNSPESHIYQKRKLLYGLWQGRREIQQADMAIVVEGMADVVTAYDRGIRNVCAPGGTALTKEQLMLLRRYTRNVTFLFDGDAAGYKAALSAVEEAVACEMRPRVCFFDEPRAEDMAAGVKRYDPDNFLRLHGSEAFRAVLDANTRDGLVWRVMEEWDPKDIVRQHASVRMAGGLISELPDEMVRDFYVRELTKKEHFGKDYKKFLEEACKEAIDAKLAKANTPTLTGEQMADVVKYGIYLKHHQYWKTTDVSSEGSPITNFVIRPVMLVVGSAKSVRLVEITNVHGHKFTANIDSDSFVELASLRKEVERRGNFLFLEGATPADFVKIKRRLYDEMKTCFPITTLGWHKLGFWSWANGIYTLDGVFHPVDEHGVVNFQENKFFLPAFAQVNDEILADDQDNSYEDAKQFVWVDGVQGLDFYEWSRRMRQVHGDNGMIAVAFYLAAVYRDIIYSKFEFFPHLNLFGPPGAGKSFLGWSLSYLFGKARRPFNLHDGTDVGFFRRMAQLRNGLAWFDEYNNDVHPKRAQGLKNAYDGAGREKGVASTDNRTVTTQVNSALIISGQAQPTQDIALFTRCISLNFSETTRSEEQKRVASELRHIEQTGVLSQLTSQLQQYREHIERDFDSYYDDVRRDLAALTEGRDVLDRLLNNYAIPLAVTLLLTKYLRLGWGITDLLEAMRRNVIAQNDSISQEDDLAIWWNIMEYYIEKDELKHGDDFLVQEHDSVTVKNPAGKATDTHELRLGEKKKILFLRFVKVYRFYLEQLRREGKNGGLNQEAVKYYLRSSPAFLGEVRAKKFNGNSHSCYAFEMGKLAFDLPLTILKDPAETPSPI